MKWDDPRQRETGSSRIKVDTCPFSSKMVCILYKAASCLQRSFLSCALTSCLKTGLNVFGKLHIALKTDRNMFIYSK